MKTMQEVLEALGMRIDRPTLEEYIERQWLRPVSSQQEWHFEEIDIARLQLVCHLTQDLHVNEEGMDVVLSLLDQLYGLRAQMKHLTHAVTRQPPEVQEKIQATLIRLSEGSDDE